LTKELFSMLGKPEFPSTDEIIESWNLIIFQYNG
jgi:hypothetical protein